MPDDNKLKSKLESFKETKEVPGQVESKPEQFEQATEQVVKDISTDKLEEQAQGIEQIGESTKGIATAASLRKEKEERQKKIEGVLAEDLEDIYVNLPPNQQQEFKQKGEETAIKINTLIDKGKVKVKKIVNLIKKWLSLIPGINKFFLEQEAKIKTDEIIKLKNEKLFK